MKSRCLNIRRCTGVLLIVALQVFLMCLSAGCSIRLVSGYDAATEEEIFKCAKMIDQFYGKLIETDANKRQYAAFADQYVTIETELRSLVLRNKVRSLNEDSTLIAENILKLWVEYRDLHKEKNAYSDGNAGLDRDRFARMFSYAARAEGAKKPGASDTK
jgi:hypothetical protein